MTNDYETTKATNCQSIFNRIRNYVGKLSKKLRAILPDMYRLTVSKNSLAIREVMVITNYSQQ